MADVGDVLEAAGQVAGQVPPPARRRAAGGSGYGGGIVVLACLGIVPLAVAIPCAVLYDGHRSGWWLAVAAVTGAAGSAWLARWFTDSWGFGVLFGLAAAVASPSLTFVLWVCLVLARWDPGEGIFGPWL